MICLYCEKPVLAKGMCSKHYTRSKNHGSPFIVKSPRGEAQKFINSIPETDNCIIWPFKSYYKTGYGSIFFNGKLTGAHRAACIIHHGPPPTGQHQAAHLCGYKKCVNPRHIRWATPSENAQDKILHGTNGIGERNPMAKLKASDVVKIKMAKGQVNSETLANIFNCSPRLIRLIWQGGIWRHIDVEALQAMAGSAATSEDAAS